VALEFGLLGQIERRVAGRVRLRKRGYRGEREESGNENRTHGTSLVNDYAMVFVVTVRSSAALAR
jgi:hypothetical protein